MSFMHVLFIFSTYKKSCPSFFFFCFSVDCLAFTYTALNPLWNISVQKNKKINNKGRFPYLSAWKDRCKGREAIQIQPWTLV